MANWDRQIVGAAPQVMIRVELWEEGQDAANNTSWVRFRFSFLTSNGSRTGTWEWWLDVDGARRGGGSFGGSHSGWQTMIDSGMTVWHDANGYRQVGAWGFGDAYFGSGDTGGTLTLNRLGWPPANNAPVGSNTSVVSARITASVANNGRGTSIASYNIRYRPVGGSWVERGFGGATWDLTGLTPGTTYEMGSCARNNNGDTADWTSGTYTFTTLPAPNTSVPLMKIVGIL